MGHLKNKQFFNPLGTGHKVTARVGWSDLGLMGHGKSLGSFDGPPIFWYVHGWATKQKPRVNYILHKDINNKSKQNYPIYQMMLLKPVFYTTTRSGRIIANTTNWRAAQYRVGQS